ncbi:MAG: TIGR02301 family protein [Parvularcula sp.]|nr:TIGR02301 family protein [Parvularcula sp.]
MLVRRFIFLALAALTLGGISAATAQDLETYRQRQADLETLAGLFGELHHLRRTCDPRFEADTWRDRMKKLIELEEPQETEQQALVQAFNTGYRDAQRRYPRCDRRARDYAASRAAQGEPVIARLTAPLHAEEEEETLAPSPYVITPETE